MSSLIITIHVRFRLPRSQFEKKQSSKRLWDQTNKAKIAEYLNTPVFCDDCNKSIIRKSIHLHKRTKAHQRNQILKTLVSPSSTPDHLEKINVLKELN